MRTSMILKRTVALVASAALAFVVASCGADTTDEAAAPGGVSDSIGVHGAWSIDVVDPDGSVVESIDFHNEFVGQEILSQILLGERAGGAFLIAMSGDSALCTTPSEACAEPAESSLGDDGESIVLNADLEVEFAGDITVVEGQHFDNDGVPRPFSRKAMATAEGGPGVVPVEEGQIVQVEVRYTFG